MSMSISPGSDDLSIDKTQSYIFESTHSDSEESQTFSTSDDYHSTETPSTASRRNLVNMTSSSTTTSLMETALSSLFVQHPDMKLFYDQEVIQLKGTLQNEGPNGVNVLPLITKHKADFVNLLNGKNLGGNTDLLNGLIQQEWTDAGGPGVSPLLSDVVITPPTTGPTPTPTVPASVATLFTQHPDMKLFYDQEVIQLKGTLQNEGPNGVNVLPLISKHKADFVNLLNGKNLGGNTDLLNGLIQQEWTDAGGSGVSPLLSTVVTPPTTDPTPTEPTTPPVDPTPTPTVPASVATLFTQHPDIKLFYDQEVIQLRGTLQNEGPNGVNVLPLITKHKADFVNLLNGKNLGGNTDLLNGLIQQEWTDAGGSGVSPLLSTVVTPPTTDPTPTPTPTDPVTPPTPPVIGDLATISTNFQGWIASHSIDATVIHPILAEIEEGIAAFQNSSAQNNGPSLRAYIQLNSITKELFNTGIYAKLSSPETLSTLFDALNFDPRLLPSTTLPTAPPFKAGYTVYMLNNVPPDETIQISSAQGYVAADANGLGTRTGSPTTIPLSQLPQFDGQRYIYIPNSTSSGRMTFGDPTSAHPTFAEFTTGDGVSPSYVNFTAVDSLNPRMLNIQLTNDKGTSSRSGVSTDTASLFASMESLYNSYDPTGVWASTMLSADGSIKSGKNMHDPRIAASLSNYLSSSFIPGITQSNPLHFTIDWVAQKGYFVPSNAPSGWNFQVVGGISMPIPALDDVDSWLSGSDAGWNSNPGKTPMTSPQWAITKSLSGLVNVGITPSNINSSPVNPIINDYFNDIDNIKNFYGASFYNLYRRAVHESGVNAYASDFDDVLNADGTLIGAPQDHSFFTISFAPLTASEAPNIPVEPSPTPTPTPIPTEPAAPPIVDLTALLTQQPDIKALFNQEVVQLTGTLNNEGPNGPNVLPLIAKHRLDFESILKSKNIYSLELLNALCQLEWTQSGGPGVSPVVE